MKNQIKITITGVERVIVVAALMRFGVAGDGIQLLAERIAAVNPFDPADDGPEVALLQAIQGARSGRWENCTPSVEDVPR